MNGFRSSFQHIYSHECFSSTEWHLVFSFRCPPNIVPPAPKNGSQAHLHKTAPSKTDPPNVCSHPYHTPRLLGNHGSAEESKKLARRICCMFVFRSFPLVFSHMPSLTKLSVLPEVDLCHHLSAPLPSLETPSDSCCSRQCSRLSGLCFIDVTRIFDVRPCFKFDFGFLSKSLILDCHNLCNWVMFADIGSVFH